MMCSDRPPLIGIPACFVQGDGVGHHQVAAKYVDGVVDGAGGLPLLIPALGPRLDADAVLAELDGLMITGSPSNVEPRHYGGPAPRPDCPLDPARDATTLPLIRRALDLAVPLFAICRGLQELNVALGGTLHQNVHELPGRADHRSDKTVPLQERYGPAHPVQLVPGGMVQGCWTAPGRLRSTRCTRRRSTAWPIGLPSRRSPPTARSRRSGSWTRRASRSRCSGIPSGGCSRTPYRAACSPRSARPAGRARARQRARHERHGALAPGA